MSLHKNLHWFIYAIFLISCARQSSPTGGPKDTIAPVLIRAIPKNEAVNFNAKEIELIFSEDVILNAPKEQLIVTPTIGKDYKIVARKNTVRLEFEDPLLDSTTPSGWNSRTRFSTARHTPLTSAKRFRTSPRKIQYATFR
jgi:hypothetical protein